MYLKQTTSLGHTVAVILWLMYVVHEILLNDKSFLSSIIIIIIIIIISNTY
jgi:hypothetical protein